MLVAEPSSLTSFKLVAYSALDKAGGGAGKNCVFFVKANGVTPGKLVKTAKPGYGPGNNSCQLPGVGGNR